MFTLNQRWSTAKRFSSGSLKNKWKHTSNAISKFFKSYYNVVVMCLTTKLVSQSAKREKKWNEKNERKKCKTGKSVSTAKSDCNYPELLK